jgi:hypothetical protein
MRNEPNISLGTDWNSPFPFLVENNKTHGSYDSENG